MRLFKTTVSTLALTSACGMFLLIGSGCGSGIFPVDSDELGLGGGLVKPSVSAKPICDLFTASGETAQEDPGEGPFVGLATVVIDGTTYEDVAVETVVLEVRPLPNGILLVRTSHTFDFNDADPALAGTFTTIDRAHLTPTDPPCVFRLDGGGLIDAEQGTGVFAGSTGGMRGIGNEVDFCLGEATWAFNGTVCFWGE